MPKVPLTLQAAKGKDSDILAKLQKVQQAAHGSKQNTKLNQQRLEWTEQARNFHREARKLEDDLADASLRLGVSEAQPSADEASADVWFQINGVRQLLGQVKRRNVDRLRQNPDQAIELQSVLASVVAAVASMGDRLGIEVCELEQETAEVLRPLRRELTADGAWSAERAALGEDRGGLSDEEDALLERIGSQQSRPSSSAASGCPPRVPEVGCEAYEGELRELNEEVTKELSGLEREASELRQRRSGWDDEAHFRFACIKRQFQGRGRELLVDRLSLEFPHLTREQIHAHEEHCDSLKFVSQKQHAAFRQWRRARVTLLRRHQGMVEEHIRSIDLLAARRQDHQEQRGRQKKLHGRLEVERARASSERMRKRQSEEEENKRVRAMEEARDMAHRRHVQAMKKMSTEYAGKKREREQHLQAEAADLAQREAERYEAEQDRNAERVKLRRQMDDLKQRESAQLREAALQERRERELRLERLLERIRVEAPRDPERLLKVPERKMEDAYLDPLQCVVRGSQSQVHFDENRLMADARYKISAALQAAGLFDTRAGHEVLRQVAAPRAPAPHQVSTVFSAAPPIAPTGYPK